MQRSGRPSLHQQFPAEHGLHGAAGGFGPHGIDAHVGPQRFGGVFDEHHRVFQRHKVVGLAGSILSRELETVIHAIDHDDSSRPEEPGAPGRHDAYRAGSEDHDSVTGLDTAHLCRLIARWHHVGEHHRVVRVHAFRNDRGTYISIRDADVLRLSAIVAARGVRVAEDAAYRGGLGVGFVAIAVQSLLAKDARSAGDVERYQDVVADLQLLHVLTELLHHAGELVAERHPYSGIRNGAVVQV